MKTKVLIVFLLLLNLIGQIPSSAEAKEEYMKKGYFDPPEQGDQIYKEDADKGWGWVKDQGCLLCHVDEPPNPPYKEWDWKDKYSLNANGKAFMDSGYQRLMVPGNSPLAEFLAEQKVALKIKNHEEGTNKIGRGDVEKEGKYYRLQWLELEKAANPGNWSLTPGYSFKDIKFKEIWMKYDPETGQGEHWGKLEIKGETEVLVNGKKVKQEIKFDGLFAGTNSGGDGRKLKGKLWTTGLGKDSYIPADSYYDNIHFVEKNLKTLWAEYSLEMAKPWVTNDPVLGLIVTPDNNTTVTISKGTWSVEYRKSWNGVNVHQNFAADTMKCAVCHSTHRAQGDSMISRKSEVMLCILCHDGTGSKYNVLGGMIANKYDSAAGPIDKWVSKEAGATGKTFEVKKATSKHDMKYTTLLAAAPGGSATWTGELRCTSCHNPHGSTNFRSLRATPNPYNWKEYGGTNRIEVKAEILYGGPDQKNETVNYLTGMTEFCSSCHVDYIAGKGSGSEPYYHNPMFGPGPQDPEMYGTRRHAMYVDGNDNPRYPFTGQEATVVGNTYFTLRFESRQKVPAAFGGEQKDHNAAVMCLTCHFAHGTTVPETNSEAIGGGNQDWYKNGLGTTKLLRAPGRGVCMACHRQSLMETPY